MNGINCWAIDVRQVSFATVLKWCQQHHRVDRLLLGIQIQPGRKNGQKHGIASPAQLQNASRYFAQHVLSVYSVKGWPPSLFFGTTQPVLEIELNTEVIDTCLDIGPNLADWTSWNDERPLPEDPCLFKAGAQYPNLVTVAHEEEAWLLSDRKVNLHGVKLDLTVRAKDLFFDGACFCKDARPCRSRLMQVFMRKMHTLRTNHKAKGTS